MMNLGKEMFCPYGNLDESRLSVEGVYVGFRSPRVVTLLAKLVSLSLKENRDERRNLWKMTIPRELVTIRPFKLFICPLSRVVGQMNRQSLYFISVT